MRTNCRRWSRRLLAMLYPPPSSVRRTSSTFERTSSLSKRFAMGSDRPQDQDDDVVRVSTDLVVVNVTVIDKDGNFLKGLKRTDFQILEDGVPQKTSTFSAEETPFAAAILLDTSGSMESRLT